MMMMHNDGCINAEHIRFLSKKQNKYFYIQCELMGLSRQRMYEYLRGEVITKTFVLARISNYYRASTDFLLGRCNEYEPIETKINGRIDNVRLLKLIASKDSSIIKQCEESGICKSLFYKNIKGNNSMSSRELCKLADYYGVTTDFLLGR